MISLKKLSALTCLALILFGILLPIALGVRDLEVMAAIFSVFLGIYAVLVIVTTFLIKPGLRIKVSRQNGVTVVRYELQNRRAVNADGPKQNP